MLLIGGAGVLLAMFLGFGDVVGTQFFGQPIHGAKEITESTMVLVVFGALTYAQIRNSHIRVEIIYTRVGPRAKAIMDVASGVAALVFFGMMIWQCIGEAMISTRIGEVTDGLIRFPLYPARWILVVGAGLLIAQLLLDLIRDIQRVGGKEGIAAPQPPPLIPDIPGLENNDQ